MSFQDQVAVITGAASGIGHALAVALAGAGARVVLTDIDGTAVEAATARLQAAGRRVECRVLDVTDAAAVAALISETIKRHGRIDLMFNNAGIAITGDARDLDVARWRRVVEVNLMGVIHGSDAAYRVMCAQGHGHIINIASLAGLIPFPTNAPYSTTKHAVVGLSMSLRTEGADLGVKVSVVCPGFIESNIYAASEAVNLPREKMNDQIPFAKVTAEDAARLILEGVRRNRAVIVFPRYARVLSWLYRFNPGFAMPLGRRMIRDLRKMRLQGRD
jgi:short-subunit dehydrogenase